MRSVAGWAPVVVAAVNLAIAVDNARRFHRLDIPHAPVDTTVWVLIPARDEAARIGPLIADLRAQSGLADLRVRILDDASTDQTLAVADRAVDGDPRFAVLASAAAPADGANPKVAALLTLLDRGVADGTSDDLVMFLDADVRLSPDAVPRAAATFGAITADRRRRRLPEPGLLTVWPAELAHGCLQQLVQPLLAWSWLTSVPLRVTQGSLRPSTAIANGQFLVTRLGTYLGAGGHRPVIGAAAEDLALARHLRTLGWGTEIRCGADTAHCRMYEDDHGAREGYRRWLAEQFGGDAGALAVAAVVVSVYSLPAVTLVFGTRRVRAAIAIGLAVTSRLLSRRVECGRLTAADLAGAIGHPLSATVFAAAVTDSVVARRRGHRSWRGRRIG
ncbi:glycosyltransferase family 2 protein [Williamsia sterculiae]|uniref:4,4'-diaponeurosporenoate glycosyltransferase n=1 Tax=Williamsia sterculiae TaxID=1344003 RepID=A0A1N7H7L5_9NOCA|nr:glycosyltransferase family 2 protein [Williamsia sterculiae]SIS20658.1 Glycosyl transferase family 2 [Williamsia sterculiae]